MTDEEEKKEVLKDMKWRLPNKILKEIELIKINRFRISQVNEYTEEFEETNGLNSIDYSLIEYLKTLNGSKEYQKYYDSINEEEQYSFLHSIHPHVSELIQDEYANYLMQKICDSSSAEIRQLFLQSISHILP